MSDQGQQQQQQQGGGDQGGAKPWFDGADADTIGYLQNRGLDKKPANEAAFAAIKAHREAERHLGAPADRLVRLPKDAADEAGIKDFRTKIGVPDDVKGYDFKDIKFTDGTELDDAFKDTISQSFLRHGVTKDAAPGITRDIVKFMETQDKASTEADLAKAAQEADELSKSWGANLKTNTFIANQAAEKLGLDKDLLDKMVGQVGRTAVAQALLKMGQMMGEDKFVKSGGPGSDGIMTREQAIARKNELMGDSAWRARVEAGDRNANAELHNLSRLIAQAA